MTTVTFNKFGYNFSDIHMLLFQSYFCGSDEECMMYASKAALQRAKANIVQWFPIVGVLEFVQETVTALEHNFPEFFSGLNSNWQERRRFRMVKMGNITIDVQEKTKEKLKKMLSVDYDLYNFVVQRLMHQFTNLEADC